MYFLALNQRISGTGVKWQELEQNIAGSCLVMIIVLFTCLHYNEMNITYT
jgi:hypothetical protein